MSPELLAFYRAYRDWLAAGAPLSYDTDSVIRDHYGLCRNLWLWAQDQNQDASELFCEMEQQFRAAGLNHHYPFNDGAGHYTIEQAQRQLHTNSHRIRWVLEHAK